MSMLAAFSVAEPSDEPVSPSAREIKVPKPRQILQFERPWDHFVPAKSVRKLTARVGVSKKFVRAGRYRILPLVSSIFPRVTRRQIIAIITRAAMAMRTFNGVIKPGFSGVGVGVAVGAGAFFAASIPCAYCKRWKVSLSCGFSFCAAW